MGTLKVIGVAVGAVVFLASAALGGTYLYWRSRVDAAIEAATAHIEAVAAQPDSRPSYLEPGPPEGTLAERSGRAVAALDRCRRAGEADQTQCDAAIDAWLAAPRAARRGRDVPELWARSRGPSPYQRAQGRLAAHAAAGRTREHLTACLDRLAWSRDLESFHHGADPRDTLQGHLDRTMWLHHCVLSLASAESALLTDLAPAVARLRAGFLPPSHHRARRAASVATTLLRQAGGEEARQALSTTARGMLSRASRMFAADPRWDGPTLHFLLDDPFRSFADLERLEGRLARALAQTDRTLPDPPATASRAQLELFATALALRATRGNEDASRRHPALAGERLVPVDVSREGSGWRLTAAGASLIVPPRAPPDANARLAAARAVGRDALGAEPTRKMPDVVEGVSLTLRAIPADDEPWPPPQSLQERDGAGVLIERMHPWDGAYVELALPLDPPPAAAPDADAPPAGAARP